jgi:arginase family enzyme
MATTLENSDEFVRLLVPTVHGGTPTAYGAPLGRDEKDFRDADAAFLGIQWAAPMPPDFTYMGYGANFGTTGASPGQFRFTSLRHRGGFLPELDLAVFDAVRLVDAGDVPPTDDMAMLLSSVENQVSAMRKAGCTPITYGGNAGPASYAVACGVAQAASGPLAVVNFDAHGDNRAGDWRTESPSNSSWGGTWVHQLLKRPEIDASRFWHFGLRGPANDAGVLKRFGALGVERGQIVSYGELKQARRRGFDEWVDQWAATAVDGAAAVWIAIDIDVLDIGSNPHYADDALGPTADELIDSVAAVVRACGPERFAGLSFMAIPPAATSLHIIASYVILHALAAMAPSARS